MHRPLAAACAACLSTFITYPLDSMKLSKQTGVVIDEKYKGCLIHSGSKFVATGVYFTVYERFVENIPLATFGGLVCSNMISVPTDIVKKKKQASLHPSVPMRVLPKIYALDVLKSYPKNFIKYALYEYYRFHLLSFPPVVYGFLSSLLSSVIVSLLFHPIDVLKSYMILEDTTRKKLAATNGMKEGLVLSVTSNVLGHTLMELWGPRFK